MTSQHLTPPPPPVILTEAALCAWIGAAAPRDRLVYHRGFLPLDTRPENKRLSSRQQKELQRIATRARQLAQQGVVDLLQHRHGSADYSYALVVRCRPRHGVGEQLRPSKAALAEDCA